MNWPAAIPCELRIDDVDWGHEMQPDRGSKKHSDAK